MNHVRNVYICILKLVELSVIELIDIYAIVGLCCIVTKNNASVSGSRVHLTALRC